VRCGNTEVTNIEAAGGELSWTQKDGALPMPVDASDQVVMLALKLSDFIEAINQEPLKVTGLPAARYTLRIDEQTVGTFTREQLAEGINLAMLPTPMAAQAADVLSLTRKHNDIHYARWREVQVPLAQEPLRTYEGALTALDKLEAEIIMRQRAAAQPKIHRYRLVAE
jgi:hypothetical protein